MIEEIFREVWRIGLPFFVVALAVGVYSAARRYQLIRNERKASGRRFSKKVRK